MIKLSNQQSSVYIDAENGGRLAQLHVADLQLLIAQELSPLAWGSYPMIPWVGRLRNGKFTYKNKEYSFPLNMAPHAIHGTCFDRNWEIDEVGDSHISLSISLGDTWPFTGFSKQTITLNENSLKMQLSVHTETDSFPASIGWHPWFLRQLKRGRAAELAFSAKKKFLCDETQIPTHSFTEQGLGPWDDCFTEILEKPSITWPGALKIKIESNCDHWVVYDKPTHALCIEPQTAPANALNNPNFIVTPDTPLCAETTLRWQLL